MGIVPREARLSSGRVLQGGADLFCLLSRDNVAIFLDLARTPHSALLNQYWAVYLYVDDFDAMAQELLARDVTIERGPVEQPYGCRDLDIRDPNGHLIGIGQNERSAAGQLTQPYAD